MQSSTEQPRNNPGMYQSLLDQLQSLQEQKQQLFQKLAPFLQQNQIPNLSLSEIICFTTAQSQNKEIHFQQNPEINQQKNEQIDLDPLDNEEILSDGEIKAYGQQKLKESEKLEELSKQTKKITKQKKSKTLKEEQNQRNFPRKIKKQRHTKGKKQTNEAYGNSETDKSDNSLENFEKIHWINQHANIIESMFSESQDKLELLQKIQTQQ